MREAAAPSEFVEDAELPLAADCPLLLPNVEDGEDIEPPVLEADEPMPPPLLSDVEDGEDIEPPVLDADELMPPPLLPNVEDVEDIEPPVLDADELMPPPLLLSEERLVAAAWARLL